MSFSKLPMTLALLLVGGALGAPAMAGGFGFSFGFSSNRCGPVYYSRPVYYAPAPVYYAPAPAYYAPAPVYYHSAPRVHYVRRAPVYYRSYGGHVRHYYGGYSYGRHGYGRAYYRCR